jgi:hypothetical protein
MPWTRQQVKYLLSSGSPLKKSQKEKMKGELHDDPSMGHWQKGHDRQKAAEERSREYAESRNSQRPKRG